MYVGRRDSVNSSSAAMHCPLETSSCITTAWSLELDGEEDVRSSVSGLFNSILATVAVYGRIKPVRFVRLCSAHVASWRAFRDVHWIQRTILWSFISSRSCRCSTAASSLYTLYIRRRVSHSSYRSLSLSWSVHATMQRIFGRHWVNVFKVFCMYCMYVRIALNWLELVENFTS